MKIKLTKAQIDEILANPEKAHEAGIKTNDPWWVIVLKVLAYYQHRNNCNKQVDLPHGGLIERLVHLQISHYRQYSYYVYFEVERVKS